MERRYVAWRPCSTSFVSVLDKVLRRCQVNVEDPVFEGFPEPEHLALFTDTVDEYPQAVSQGLQRRVRDFVHNPLVIRRRV